MMTKHFTLPTDDSQALTKPSVGDIPKTRPCLRCAEAFESEGFAERICRRCKSSSAWRNGMATTYGSSSRKR